jgi:hypothetical protein
MIRSELLDKRHKRSLHTQSANPGRFRQYRSPIARARHSGRLAEPVEGRATGREDSRNHVRAKNEQSQSGKTLHLAMAQTEMKPNENQPEGRNLEPLLSAIETKAFATIR